ncbi:exonuclease SbcCD subunit D [Edaphobacillus lindanitolerans]|uniref:Nuclease SbcCD subunit D n=1 Tax=Edaphobacillus lindanitolerans TaxID=550447 RepID=A0A1U7PNZ5_9BACI|nr:exonuclease SbcCD subunit D [Edaphobacillus lindanitolerans]SIT80387.1 Exodeoxyribonuclease I subunit D [Edaphobacillus lindanitolerans]
MKFFHTADWHLGKIVQGVHMTDDQRFVLEQFIEAARQERPDAIIIAGDLYDRAVPPTEAVRLLDEVLSDIVLGLEIPVIAVAGNHDSPNRLHFGSSFMSRKGYHISGLLSKGRGPVVLSDASGEVHFHCVPFADPSVVRSIYEDPSVSGHDAAMACILDDVCGRMDEDARHVFVGHAFVTPGAEPEDNTSTSERPLSIGGAEYVDAGRFRQFHYTALGHLHQAHPAGSETVRYSGSPLKYSISEEHHRKGFLAVELDADGEVTVEHRPLTPRRDMRTVEGTLRELLEMEPSEDYIFVRLLDRAPVLYPMERIRTVFPNALHIERALPVHQDRTTRPKDSMSRMDDLAMFRAFHEEIQGEEPDEETEKLFREVLDDLLGAERESGKETVRK